MANYAIVRTDKLMGTDVNSMLVSIEYLGADGKTETSIENGNVLKVGALKEGEREIFVGAAVAANDSLDDIVLVASPEIIYGAYTHDLSNFINEAGRPARGYHLHHGDIFSVTIEALAGATAPEVGNVVELAAGTKLSVAASATSGSTTIGKIIAIDIVGGVNFYVIEVA